MTSGERSNTDSEHQSFSVLTSSRKPSSSNRWPSTADPFAFLNVIWDFLPSHLQLFSCVTQCRRQQYENNLQSHYSLAYSFKTDLAVRCPNKLDTCPQQAFCSGGSLCWECEPHRHLMALCFTEAVLLVCIIISALFSLACLFKTRHSPSTPVGDSSSSSPFLVS